MTSLDFNGGNFRHLTGNLIADVCLNIGYTHDWQSMLVKYSHAQGGSHNR